MDVAAMVKAAEDIREKAQNDIDEIANAHAEKVLTKIANDYDVTIRCVTGMGLMLIDVNDVSMDLDWDIREVMKGCRFKDWEHYENFKRINRRQFFAIHDRLRKLVKDIDDITKCEGCTVDTFIDGAMK